MDSISEFDRSANPHRAWGKTFFDFLTTNFDWFFDSIADGLTVVARRAGRSSAHDPAGASSWRPSPALPGICRSWKLALAVLGLLFIINQDLWKETVETLVLVVAAAAASMAIGVPIGIWAAHNERGYRYLQPILDLMQTMPTFVYLIPVLILFGLGIAPGLIVTVIFAAPAPIRLTYLGITSVPKPMIEAGEAFGATSASCCGRSSCRPPSRPSWPASPSASCCASPWWSSRR